MKIVSFILVCICAFFTVSSASARVQKTMSQAELFIVSSGNQKLQKSGTPQLLELLHGKTAKAVEFQSTYSTLSRPQQDAYVDSQEGHFRVHYDTSGSNAPNLTDANVNGIPDFVDSTLVYLEYAYSAIIALAYGSPKSDVSRGGSAAIDIYLQDLASLRYYGYTSPDTGLLSIDSAYMVLDNNYTDSIYSTKGYSALRVTSAHELFHVFHYSYYGADDAVWWMEQSATWMEDHVWDDVNDYLNYLSAFLTDRESSLDYFSGMNSYAYGASLFAFMLAKKYNPIVLQSIWSSFKDNQSGSIELLRTIVPNGLPQALCDLGVWSYFTGSRSNSSAFFKDSPLITTLVSMSDTLTAIPAVDSLSFRRYTFKYVEITPATGFSASDSLAFDFIDRTGNSWKKQLILYNSPDDYLIKTIDENHYLLTPDRSFKKAVLVIANASSSGTGRLVYSLQHTTGTEDTITAFSLKQNYPNPFNKETTIIFAVPVTSPVKLRVFNIMGQMVRLLVDGTYEKGTHTISFDASKLSSGMYFARLESGSTILTRKMMYLK